MLTFTGSCYSSPSHVLFTDSCYTVDRLMLQFTDSCHCSPSHVTIHRLMLLFTISHLTIHGLMLPFTGSCYCSPSHVTVYRLMLLFTDSCYCLVIFNKSLKTGIVPEDWKSANVTLRRGPRGNQALTDPCH